jgi:hypothetical protein
MSTGTESFFHQLLADKSLGLGGIERALALRGLEEAETEEVGRKMLAEDWRLSPGQREILGAIVDALAERRARSERGLKARLARLARMAFNAPVTK